MKKFFTGVLLLLSSWSYAQSTSYTFIREGGQMSVLNTNDSGVVTYPAMDDFTTKVKLGFSFNFNGELFDSIGISENGYIWFGPAQPEEMEGIVNPITDALPLTVKGVVCAFGIDLHPRSGQNLFTTFRTGPQKHNGQIDNFIIEWNNTTRWATIGDPAGEDTISVQIQLFRFEEHRVQITYGQMGLNPNFNNQISVGIKGASMNDFALRMTDATHNWQNTTEGTSINSTCELSVNSNPTAQPFNFMSWYYRPTTGLKEMDASQWNVYPVPANDLVYVQTTDRSASQIVSYDVMDLAGKKVLEGSYNGSSVDVSSLTPGVYVLAVYSKDGVARKKIVKN